MLLRIFRTVLALVLFVAITAFFLDFAQLLPQGLSRLMKIQFVPALVGNWKTLVCLLVMALVLGRFYCSTICPLGVLQDIIAWIGKRFHRNAAGKPARKRYQFSPARSLLRWSVFVVFFVALALQINIVAGPLDPYAAYGRIATHLFRPVYMAGNNGLAWVGSLCDSYRFYYVSILFSAVPFLIALGTLILVGVLAYRGGRTYCNTICPVGTLLGLLARFSIFKVRIQRDKCVSCGLCEARCKGHCIDAKNKAIDSSRCVVCFDCLGACKQGAIGYTIPLISKKQATIPEDSSATSLSPETTQSEPPAETPVTSSEASQTEPQAKTPAEAPAAAPKADRRAFLGLVTAAVATAATAPAEAVEKLEEVRTGQVPSGRTQAMAPPGSISVKHLKKHCTACHLCVTKCPDHVLKPAFLEYGLGGMTVPTLDFTEGFCNEHCTVCGEICPNGAILPLTEEERMHTQVGRVHFVEENCVVKKNETNCGACAEHCPTQALKMVPYKGALTIPQIDPDLCIGCGACEHICPTRPYRAVFVEGLAEHGKRKDFEEKKQDVEVDDFGF